MWLWRRGWSGKVNGKCMFWSFSRQFLTFQSFTLLSAFTLSHNSCHYSQPGLIHAHSNNDAATLGSAGVWDGTDARHTSGATKPHRGVPRNLPRAPSLLRLWVIFSTMNDLLCDRNPLCDISDNDVTSVMKPRELIYLTQVRALYTAHFRTSAVRPETLVSPAAVPRCYQAE